MKKVKCPYRKREKDVDDNVIVSICPCCQVEMMEVEK